MLGIDGSAWEWVRSRQVSQGEKMYFWLGRCDREQAAFSVALQKLGRRRQILVFSYRTSPKTPLRYQARSCSFGTGLHQDPDPIPSCKRVVMLENTLALFLCREIGAVLFCLLGHELLGRKNIFLALKPLRSTRLEKLLPAG